MARDHSQVPEGMALVNQQDEFNAPAGQEQVLAAGQVPVGEQRLEQPRVEDQGVAGQGDAAQAQQQVGNINNQQPDERRREQAGVPESQPNESGHAGRSHIYRGHSGYGRGGLGRGGYGRAQPQIQLRQSGQYISGRAGSQQQPNNLGQSLEDIVQQSQNYIGDPAPRSS